MVVFLQGIGTIKMKQELPIGFGNGNWGFNWVGEGDEQLLDRLFGC